jgi:SAM-dependent methyltransferase
MPVSAGEQIQRDEDLEYPACIICGSDSYRHLFCKASTRGEKFALVACDHCGLRFISPRPTPDLILKYYEASYFTSRTDRGYDNYFSEKTRNEVTRVLELNLADLGFFDYEKGLPALRRYLDIGCAAGYSVWFMKERGWDAGGIDIAGECVRHGRDSLGLNLTEGDFLSARYENPFHLITLWATIEHLHRPDLVVKKIHGDLFPGGMVFISTCRAGGFMKLLGRQWRYYNFPEHLYYFTFKQMKRLLEREGFEVERRAFYGSGLGRAGSLLRKTADWTAKRFLLGDMMIIAARKR